MQSVWRILWFCELTQSFLEEIQMKLKWMSEDPHGTELSTSVFLHVLCKPTHLCSPVQPHLSLEIGSGSLKSIVSWEKHMFFIFLYILLGAAQSSLLLQPAPAVCASLKSHNISETKMETMILGDKPLGLLGDMLLSYADIYICITCQVREKDCYIGSVGKQALEGRSSIHTRCSGSGSQKQIMLLPSTTVFQPVLKEPPVVDNPHLTMQANGQSLSRGWFPVQTMLSSIMFWQMQKGICSIS